MHTRLTPLHDEPQTLPVVLHVKGAQRAQRQRQAGIVLMVLFVLAGATGLLGVRSTTTTAQSNGYRLAFTHAAVARAGWDVPWRLRITHPGGFDGSVTVAITGNGFAPFESQRFWPEPSDETRGAGKLYLSFSAPPGDELVIDYDSYIQPSAQRSQPVQLTVITDGQPRVSLRASTLLLS